MAKLKLSKSALQQQKDQLSLYQRTLPSLDLKRRQLTVELDKARKEHERTRGTVDSLETEIGRQLPMLADEGIAVDGLVKMTGFQLGEENVVGVRLPLLEEIRCEVMDYSLLAKPAWVDALVRRLRDAAEARARVQVAAKRVRILAQAEKRITQRVNLFDRILIPTAKKNMQRIRIFLGDMERAGVVRSKLAKAKQGAARAAGGAAS